jgi:hypothetical protein
MSAILTFQAIFRLELRQLVARFRVDVRGSGTVMKLQERFLYSSQDHQRREILPESGTIP